MKNLILLASLTLAFVTPAFAQQNSGLAPQANNAADVGAMEQQIKDLQERIIALEGQVRMLKNTAPAPPSIATPGPVPQAQPPGAAPSAQPGLGAAAGAVTQTQVYGGAGGAAAKALNPDISVIGDFIGAVGNGTIPALASQSAVPSLQMHESELGLQAIIDPYARGDFFLSFGEEGVDVEEGYITFTALPKGFVVKAGKMRSAFGKVNLMHNHVLPWIDRPLVSTNLVAGEDGIDDAGVSVERIIPAPKGIFLEATGQLFRGDSGSGLQAVFKSWQRSDVSTVAHLRGYKDITESTNLDLGLSYARGYNDAGPNFVSNLYGIDATVRWKPLRRSIYHSFVGRSELIWSQRQQLPAEQRAFGMYASADYQLARRWFLGGRFDRSDRSRLANLADTGGSIVLTYWPSEFSQIRGQYRVTNYAENKETNELLMQVIFSLGAHGAHPF
jgi:hypothetical protein